MKWSSAVSKNSSLGDAVAECASKVRGELANGTPDLVAVFVSTHHAPEYEKVPMLVREHMDGGVLIGCSGGGVIGAGSEVEHHPGFAMAGAYLPEVRFSPFHIEDAALPDGDAPPEKWHTLVKVSPETASYFLLLTDPFSLRGEELLTGLDYAFPDSVKIGGLASGSHQPGGNALYLGDDTFRSGAVGLAMDGDIAVETIVAQGCRPIGETMHVTACARNMVYELGGRTTFEVLKTLFESLSDRDRDLAQNSLFLGVVMDEFNDDPQLGDFLIRNITGADPRQGALAVGEMLRVGQVVQFHLRDATTSAQDLDGMLTRFAATHSAFEDAGALLFSCLGRGSYLYGRADHDTDMFREKIGRIPLAGFFCNGEIGPVGGSTYLHGYTSSFGIFHPKQLT